ncbi:phenylalanine--tRNA ligase subunit beta [bacterium Unc6]|nr:phenylalanine--tRNA ligase subunit beta [bacterium Unc6]
MNISYNWLKDYIEFNWTADELAKRLTSCGLKVEKVESLPMFGDFLLEAEVTTNRADCLSMVGVAREVATVLGKTIKDPVKEATLRWETLKISKQETLSVDISSKESCHRYTGQIIKNVQVAKSPEWLIKRITSVGLRAINNIVDITNFVLMETGQPLHAFDSDLIQGNSIYVRFAKEGETIKTLDGIERKLSNNFLVIADKNTPLALAGIIGGTGSEVTENTKNVFLESAMFNPVLIRNTGRSIGLSTDSSYRFERGVDPGCVLGGLRRAALLISEIAGGKIVGKTLDEGKKPLKPKKILFNCKWAGNFLGKNIKPQSARKIFKGLGFDIKTVSREKLYVSIPPRRQDIYTAQGLCEEVARISGYDIFKSTLPVTNFRDTLSVEKISIVRQDTLLSGDEDYVFLKNIRIYLSDIGLYEAYTYSLHSLQTVQNCGIDKNIVVSVLNPLSSEQGVLRPTIIPGILSGVSRNLNRGIEGVRLFEVGHCYIKDDGYIKKVEKICIGVSGRTQKNWKEKQRQIDIFDLKGILISLLGYLKIENINFTKSEFHMFEEEMCWNIEHGGKHLGYLGRVKKSVACLFQIDIDVWMVELDIDSIKSNINKNIVFTELPKYPSVTRDISFVIDKKIAVQDVTECVKKNANDFIENVFVFDEYKGKQVFGKKKSLALSIVYRSKNKTLTDKEVDDMHNGVKDNIVKQLGVQIR